MAVQWHLKSYLSRQHNIFKATELRALVLKRTNVRISLQNICNLLNGKPRALKLATIEILCTALDCELSAFCKIKPGIKVNPNPRPLSFQNTPNGKRVKADFPDPADYEDA